MDERLADARRCARLTRVTSHPLLKTLWPVLRRGAGQVQFGTDPGHARVVDGLGEAEIAALEQLDGTRVTPAALTTPAGRELLDLLLGHGLVVDASEPLLLPPTVRALLAHDTLSLLRTTSPPVQGYAALAARGGSLALVVGRGALPEAIAAQLRLAGVGRVHHGPQVGDDWELREHDRGPGVVVLTGSGALDAAAGEPWRRRGTPVLPVVLHAVEAEVGPLVVPGGPCLRCLDLARTDRDPAWPTLLPQLAGPSVGHGRPAEGETTLVAMVAAMGSMVALAALDGAGAPPGRSLEVALPWPRVRQREWEVHPRCWCAATGDTRAPADRDLRPQARMAG